MRDLTKFDHVVCLDIETYYDNDYSLRKMTMTEYINSPLFKMHSIAIKHRGGETQYFDTDHVELAMQHLRSLKNWAMVGQNTAFDAAALNWRFGIKPDFYYDTMSMSKGFWPTESGALKELAQRVFPNDPTKRKGNDLINFLGVETLTPEQHEAMKRYNVQDVDLTMDIFEKLMEYGFPEEELYQIHMVMRMYVEPSFVIDRPLLESAIEEDVTETDNAINAALDFIKGELKASGVEFDLPLDKKLFSSNQRFARLLKEVLNIEPPIKTNAKGSPTYAFGKRDVQFIEMRSQYPDCERIFNARELAKSTIAASRAATMLRCSEPSSHNPEGRLPVPLRYYGAATGRMAGMDGINLQNLQRGSKHRLALTAPDNHLVFVSDSSNIECLSGDGRVLTDNGLKPLREVRLTDLLWDGHEWVKHDGVISKGVKDVIEYSGITGTPEHIVYLADGTKNTLRDAKANNSPLLVGEVSGQAVREVGSTKHTNPPTREKNKAVGEMSVWGGIISVVNRLAERQIDWLQKLWRNRISELSWATPINHLGLVQESGAITGGVYNQSEKTSSERITKEYLLQRIKVFSKNIHRHFRAAGKTLSNIRTTKSRKNTRTNTGILQVEVFDIVNAGPRNRFTYNGYVVSNCRVNGWFAGQTDLLDGFRHGLDVYSEFATDVVFGYPVDKSMKTERQVGKVCILGLGYGMGWRTFQRALRSGPMGAPPMACSDEFAQKCVYGYRAKYPMIAQNWKIADSIIAQMMLPDCDIQWGPLRVMHNCLLLPNGLWLSYPGLRQNVIEHANGVDISFEYWNGKFWKKTYGANIIENISQCLAGLVIKEAMNKVDRWLVENDLGRIVLQVHDEIIAVARDDHPTIGPDDIQAKIQQFMCEQPDWCPDLPLDAEGGYAKEYSK
ncbi:hypothetical protein [Pasteurella testudinis]|uniref:hypothetical protein n=1 Tax=Pasteurella testudinis TaxID=761 RepID=UPI00405986C7